MRLAIAVLLLLLIHNFSFAQEGQSTTSKTTKAVIESAQSKKEKNVSVKILIDSLDRAFFKNYIFPDKSQVIIKYLREQLKNGFYQKITDRATLARQISKDIQAAHRDPHININYDPRFAELLAGPPPPHVPGSDSLWIKNARKNNFSFRKIEILNGNIGYIRLDGFNGFVEDAKPIASAAFRFVSNTDAIIIDLRNNGGGSPWMVKQIASYFVTERTRLNDIYERKFDKTFEFWAEPELGENMKLTMPLYILTGSGTASAAEDFSYAMQVNKRAVIVGDTTAGGAHPTGPVAVGQGFVASIPFARSINHITKTDWEGTGVIPDHSVDSDAALVRAQVLVITRQIEKANSPEEKRKLSWALNALHIREYGDDIMPSLLQSYEGVYRDYTIHLKEGLLYFTDAWGDHLLRPISTTLFSAGEWIHIEFVSAGNGNVSSIKLINRNGGEELIKKTE